MKKLILSMTALALLCGCNNGTSDSKRATPAMTEEEAQKQLKEASSVEDLSRTLPPNEYSVVKENLSSEETRERYTTFPDVKYDPNLKQGMFFKEEIFERGPTANSHTVSNKEIMLIDDRMIKVHVNFDDSVLTESPLFKSWDQIFASRPHLVYQSCFVPDENCNRSDLAPFTEGALPYLENSSRGIQWSCRLSYKDHPTYKNKVDKISYTFSNQKISAFLEKTEEKGEIECSHYPENAKDPVKVTMGNGTATRLQIDSTEVVNNFATNSKNKTIYRHELVTLDNGRVLNSSVDRTILAPVRPK